jgi:2-polyprenyl-6-methoxyphenol hydroxylase-like FAD-dependent oxidoreductase
VLVTRVVIVGAGLAGLCLAQGLRQAGVDVAVYERDATASSRTQGYRISIDSRGAEALHTCLPARLNELFEGTCGQPSRGVVIFSRDGERLTIEQTTRFHKHPRPACLPPDAPSTD